MLDVLMAAAEEGGKVALKYFKKQLIITKKQTNNNDLLTDADVETQRIIQKTILELVGKKGFKKSEIGFIGEEKLDKSGEHLFIIDPIDGTANFSQGLDLFSIPIAYSLGEEILVGVIYHPTSNIFYIAQKNKGAFKFSSNKKTKLKISPKPFNECMAIINLSSNDEFRLSQLKILYKLYTNIRGARIFNSGALDYGYLSENIFNIAIGGRPKIWDLAAAKLLVEESGGHMVDWEGEKISFDFLDHKKNYPVITAHPKILPKVLKYFKQYALW